MMCVLIASIQRVVIKLVDWAAQSSTIPDGELVPTFTDVAAQEEYEDLVKCFQMLDKLESENILKPRYWAKVSRLYTMRNNDGDLVMDTATGQPMRVQRIGIRSYMDYLPEEDLWDVIERHSQRPGHEFR